MMKRYEVQKKIFRFGFSSVRLFSYHRCFYTYKTLNIARLLFKYFDLTVETFFLIEINSMQGCRATTRHRVTRKRRTKRLKHTKNQLSKNLQLIGVC